MMPNWPHPGCVGLWKFDNDDCTDTSGQGNNGSNSGGAAFTLGKFGRCTILTSDYWGLTYANSLKVSDLTVSAWYNSTSNDNPGVLIACSGIYVGGSGYGYYGYRFETRAGKTVLLINGNALVGGTAINDGKWHFLAATRDNSIARIYVDGRIDATLASPPTLVYCDNAPYYYYYAGAFIGAAYRPMIAPSTIGYHPTCVLDELMLENYAIGPEEALDRYLFQIGEL